MTKITNSNINSKEKQEYWNTGRESYEAYTHTRLKRFLEIPRDNSFNVLYWHVNSTCPEGRSKEVMPRVEYVESVF